MGNSIHAGAFELQGVSGVSLVREQDAMGIRMGFVYLALPIAGVLTVLFCMESIAKITSRRSEQ